MLTRSRLKEIFSEYHFRPLKRFGENYLIDANIKDKIIGEARLAPDDTVLEIGPGLGALTIDLASSGARVIAVEKDRKAYAILKEITAGRFPNLELVCDDILRFDPESIGARKKLKVIGNLPYYITTPIVAFLIDNRDLIDFVLMTVQREVAIRMLAKPGIRDYSAFSCFVQYYTQPEYIHTIKAVSFFPEPDVDSSIVRLDMPDKPAVDVKSEDVLFRIIRSSFNQRRKSIINSLSRKEAFDMTKDKLSALLNRIKIDPSCRPETLSLSDFARIADAMVGQS